MGAIARAQDVAQSVIGRLARVGADPSDDEDTHSGKALLVLISSLILPIAFLWGVLYLAFGPPAGIVPLVYFAVLLAALGAFARTRSSCSATSSRTSRGARSRRKARATWTRGTASVGGRTWSTVPPL